MDTSEFDGKKASDEFRKGCAGCYGAHLSTDGSVGKLRVSTRISSTFSQGTYFIFVAAIGTFFVLFCLVWSCLVSLSMVVIYYLHHLERGDEDGEKDAHGHDRNEVDGAQSPRATSRRVLQPHHLPSQQANIVQKFGAQYYSVFIGWYKIVLRIILDLL